MDLFSMKCNEVSSSELWGVYGSGVALGSLSFNAQAVFLLCWRIHMVCLALELVGSWVELGFRVGMEALDELLSINVTWSQEFSGVLKFWL